MVKKTFDINNFDYIKALNKLDQNATSNVAPSLNKMIVYALLHYFSLKNTKIVVFH